MSAAVNEFSKSLSVSEGMFCIYMSTIEGSTTYMYYTYMHIYVNTFRHQSYI